MKMTCPGCEGRGFVDYDGDGPIARQTCTECGGEGEVVDAAVEEVEAALDKAESLLLELRNIGLTQQLPAVTAHNYRQVRCHLRSAREALGRLAELTIVVLLFMVITHVTIRSTNDHSFDVVSAADPTPAVRVVA